ILARPLRERFDTHKATSQKIKAKISQLGLKQLAEKPENQASGMTAIYLPEVNGKALIPPEILPALLKKGVVFAGGLHKEIAARYIRFGHMGVSVMDQGRGDVERALKALEEALVKVGYRK
ncbi:hypothetical protein LTR66_014381, partial [Elasticomyces elasticus]